LEILFLMKKGKRKEVRRKVQRFCGSKGQRFSCRYAYFLGLKVYRRDALLCI